MNIDDILVIGDGQLVVSHIVLAQHIGIQANDLTLIINKMTYKDPLFSDLYIDNYFYLTEEQAVKIILKVGLENKIEKKRQLIELFRYDEDHVRLFN